MLKRLKKQIKSSDGSLDIFSFVTGVIVSIFLICMLLDLMLIGWQFNGISQLNTQIARTASIQGGVLNTAPRDYPGNYVTLTDLSNTVNSRMRSLGVPNSEYQVDIGNGSIGRNGDFASSEYDYKTHFTTRVTTTYHWKFLRMLFPIAGGREISSTRPAMSEWKYNYGTWDGE